MGVQSKLPCSSLNRALITSVRHLGPALSVCVWQNTHEKCVEIYQRMENMEMRKWIQHLLLDLKMVHLKNKENYTSYIYKSNCFVQKTQQNMFKIIILYKGK